MKTNATTVTTGAVLVGLSSFCYAFNPIFGKLGYSAGANAISLGTIRFIFAALGMWAIVTVRREEQAISLGQRLRLLALGAGGIALVALLYFIAVEHVEASLATGLFYTFPVFIAAAGLVRGEGLSRAGAAGLVLTGAGTWLLLGQHLGGQFTWTGVLLILGSAVVYAAYILVGATWMEGISPTVATAHLATGGAVLYLVLALITRPALPGPGAYVAGAGLALVTTIFALITFWAGLPKIGATRASIISTLEPVFTALLAVLLLHDRLSGSQTLGITLVVFGAAAAQLKERRTPSVAG